MLLAGDQCIVGRGGVIGVVGLSWVFIFGTIGAGVVFDIAV